MVSFSSPYFRIRQFLKCLSLESVSSLGFLTPFKCSFLLNSFKSVFISISLGPGVGVKEKPLHNNLTLAISNGKLVKSSTLRVVLLYKGSLTTGAFVSFFTTGAFVSFLTADYWNFPVECYLPHLML